MLPLSLSSGTGGFSNGIAHTSAGRGNFLDEPGDRFFRATELATDQGHLKLHATDTNSTPPLHRAGMKRTPTAARNIAREGWEREQFFTQQVTQRN
jgi:hypothetical protein